MKRRHMMGVLLAALMPATRAHAKAVTLLRRGGVLLMRHAVTEPGIGDPPGFRLGDCSTQRTLSDAGRRQAIAAGERLRTAGVRFDEIWSSAWCRCLDTAALMAPNQPVRSEPALNSIFAGQGDRDAQTSALRQLIAGLPQERQVLAITHQVNVLALTGDDLAMGGAILLAPDGRGGVRRLGRIGPDGDQ